MIKVDKKDLSKIAFLFEESKYDTVMIRSVLEGYFGTAHVDSIENPTVARLDTGSFTMFAGDAESDEVLELIKVNPVYIVTPETEEWMAVLRSEFKYNITDLNFTECISDDIAIKRLNEIIDSLSEDYSIRKIDRELAKRLPDDIDNEYFFENFNDIEDFMNRGVGYCVLHADKIVSAATSTAACNTAIDVEIQTDLRFREKGLGRIVGAALVKHCINNHLTPHWLAANESSLRLAIKLGYVEGRRYTTFEIFD